MNDLALRRARLACVAAIGTLGAAAPVMADETTPQSISLVDEASKNGVFQFDYGVPYSPALNLIGLTPDKTTVSTSLKPFVLSLPGLASGDNADKSAALDISPFWLLGNNDKDGYDEFVNGGYAKQFAYRFRTEFAVFTGDNGGGDPTKSKASELAVGFSVSLLPGSDPLTVKDPEKQGSVWKNCLDEKQKSLAPYLDLPAEDLAKLKNKQDVQNFLTPPYKLDLAEGILGIKPAPGETSPERLKAAKAALAAMQDVPKSDAEKKADSVALTAVQGCTTQANNAARFAPNLSVGAGANIQGTGGSLSGFKNTSAVFWLSGKYPLSKINFANQKTPDTSDGGRANNADVPEPNYWMIGGSARASLSTMVATGDSVVPQISANTFNGWLGLERNSSWLVISAQAGYQDVVATNASQSAFSKSGWRWLASTSLKLSSLEDGIWLNGSYGSARGTTQTLDDKTFMLSLSFGPANPAHLFGEGAGK